MHRPVVNIRRYTPNSLTLAINARVSLSFLFIADVVCEIRLAEVRSSNESTLLTFSAALNSLPFHSNDSLRK
jgi:hypothetical protein